MGWFTDHEWQGVRHTFENYVAGAPVDLPGLRGIADGHGGVWVPDGESLVSQAQSNGWVRFDGRNLVMTVHDFSQATAKILTYTVDAKDVAAVRALFPEVKGDDAALLNPLRDFSGEELLDTFLERGIEVGMRDAPVGPRARVQSAERREPAASAHSVGAVTLVGGALHIEHGGITHIVDSGDVGTVAVYFGLGATQHAELLSQLRQQDLSKLAATLREWGISLTRVSAASSSSSIDGSRASFGSRPVQIDMRSSTPGVAAFATIDEGGGLVMKRSWNDRDSTFTLEPEAVQDFLTKAKLSPAGLADWLAALPIEEFVEWLDEERVEYEARDEHVVG